MRRVRDGESLHRQDEALADEEGKGLRMKAISTAGGVAGRRMIQRIPSAGSDFGTYRYCGFGITTPIPGFVKDLFTDSYDVDYTTGCAFVAGNAWSSVWELYDASNRRLDSDSEVPFGDYSIEAGKVNAGTPSDGSSAKWSLWYRITRSNPWVASDDDAYPYHYVTFDVYSEPISNPRTSLREELGPVVWQDNFTPAEDGASLEYSFSATATRSTEDSQTTSVSATVEGGQTAQVGFEYEGLTGGFARNLSFSATASISRTHSISISSTDTFTRSFRQGDLRGGVTYRITGRPIYHLIDGSVDAISHRDGVITSMGGRIAGGIRKLKGIDIRIEPIEARAGQPGAGAAAGRWSCKASCNVQGSAPECQNRRVEGRSSGQPNQEAACREAKRDATQKAPRGCYARHCRCFDCNNR